MQTRNDFVNPINVVDDTMQGNNLWCVGQHSQRLAAQDCVLSNVHRFRYLLLSDLDEFVIPVEVGLRAVNLVVTTFCVRSTQTLKA